MAALPELGSRKAPVIQVDAYRICRRDFPHGWVLAYPLPHVNEYHWGTAVDLKKEFPYIGANVIDLSTMTPLYFKEGLGEILQSTDKISLYLSL